MTMGTSLVVQWLRLHAPNVGSIPGRGTRSHMPATTKGSVAEKTDESTCCNSNLGQQNKLRNSVQSSCSVVSDPLRPRGLQYARPPSPSPTPGVFSNSCPSSRWCHPTISSSVVPFSSCLQSFPASGSFPMSQLFTSGGQSIAVSASTSVLPVSIQDWFPLGWTGWISLLSKGHSLMS